MNSKDTVAILLALEVLLRRRALTTHAERHAIHAVEQALEDHKPRRVVKHKLAPREDG
jgi:hypothetical protein